MICSYTHILQTWGERLSLIRVRSWGDVRRPPADQFRGLGSASHEICGIAWNKQHKPTLIISSYPQGHLIMALFTFIRLTRGQLKEAKPKSSFSSFYWSHVSKGKRVGGPTEQDKTLGGLRSGCILRRATFSMYLHSHPWGLSQALGPIASPHQHTDSLSAWANSSLTTKTKQHIAEVSAAHRP